MKNKSTSLSLTLLLSLSIILGVATFVEKYKGSNFANHHFYHSSIVFLLFFTISTIALFILYKKHKNLSFGSIILHSALILALIGAILTHVWGRSGKITITEIPSSSFLDNSSKEHIFLPFGISLDTAYIEYHNNSFSPSNFKAKVKIFTEGASFSKSISINHILNQSSYRFCLNQIISPTEVVLLVNYDPMGILLTYTAYALFILGGILTLFSKRGQFRQHLTLLRRITTLTILIYSFSVGKAQRSSIIAPTTPSQVVVPRRVANALSEIQIFYKGRTTPVETFALDFTRKLRDADHYDSLNCNQFFWSCIFYFNYWKRQPIIYIKNKSLRKRLNISEPNISLVSLFADKKGYILMPFLSKANATSQSKAIWDLNEAVETFIHLHQATDLKIFPYSNTILKSENIRPTWYTPTSPLPSTLPSNDSIFIRNILTFIRNQLIENNQDVLIAINKLKKFQHLRGQNLLHTDNQNKAEILYNRISLPRYLFMMNLLLGFVGLICFLLYFSSSSNPYQKRWAKRYSWVTHVVIFAEIICVGIYMVLRSYIIHRIAISTGFETLMFVSWLILLIGVFLGRKTLLILFSTLLMTGFTFLVASLDLRQDSINYVMPVLNSPLMSIHVTIIMLSYALLGFTFFISLVALFLNKKKQEELRVLSLVFIEPAIILLGTGIFIGAIWANISWGSYWSWDPKEVWALVTLFIYSIPLHYRLFPYIKPSLRWHSYMLFAILSPIITYWGVSDFLGGMHAYQ